MFVMSLWFLLLVSVLLCTSSSSSPTSELTSKISGVEDLLEDFRHELQRDGADPGRMQEDAGRDVCVSSFTRTQESIIRASASIDQGAEYLTSPAHVISRTHCVHACCSHPHCTDVIIHEDLQRDSLTCYLFNCTHRGRNVCLFSPQPGFSTYSRGNSTGPGRTPAHRGSDEPPRSDAGQDLVVQLPTDWAVLDARDSTDDDGVLQYQWTLVEGNPSVHMKVTHPGLLKLSGLREGMYTFQITVTDTAGQKSSDNVSVSVLAPASNAEVCTGHCSRYQFMCDDGCCIDIGYACDGKQHCPDRSDEDFCQNFDSRQKSSPPFKPVVDLETERAAQQPSTKIQSTDISYKPEQHYAMINQDPCALSPVVGPCKGAFPRWYYDAVTGQCLHFLYGGCKGNHNNFLQKSECVNECIQKTLPKQQVTSAPSTIITTHTATVASVYKEKYQSPFLMRQNSLPVPEEHHIIQGHPPPESGAILPLAMGLIISILLLLMVIGRLWLVRRRLKKALPLTTEESDYLINGMYL